jgi:hypothetical protein
VLWNDSRPVEILSTSGTGLDPIIFHKRSRTPTLN